MPKLATFTEDFTTLNSSKWNADSTFAPFTGGRGRVYAVAQYAGMATVARDLDLNGSQMVLQLFRPTRAGHDFGIELKAASYGGGQTWAGLQVNSTGFTSTLYGDDATKQSHAGVPTNPWVRIRDAGTALLTFEVSSDGLAWTQIRQVQWGGSFPTDGWLNFYAGGGADNTTAVDYGEIDNLNLAPSAGVTGTATLSSASNMTAAGVVTKLGAATLSAASNLTASGGAPVLGIVSPMSAASNLSASGLIEAAGSASLGASSDLSAAAFLEQLGAASLDAGSDLSVTVSKETFGSAALNAASALTATGTVTAAPAKTQNLDGWRHLMREDFTRPATLGNFRAVYGDEWAGYDYAEDTSRNLGRPAKKAGLYNTFDTVTVHDGMMDMHVFTGADGQPRVAAPVPPLPTADNWSQLYGRYEARFKTTAAQGYKVAWLLWPAEPNGWTQGEIDFPEGGLGENIGFFSHQVNGNPAINQYYIENLGVSMLDWHTCTIEWSPGRLRFLLDGVEVGNTTDPRAVPNVKMYWVLQTETHLSATAPPAASDGHVYVDHVSAWAYDPTAVGPTVPVIQGQVALDGASDLQAQGRIDEVRTVQAEASLSGLSDLKASGSNGSLRWFFRPPSRRVRHKGAGRLVLHIQGMTVVRKGTFFSQIEGEVDFARWDEVWLGGYEHYTTQATYLALLEAGYGSCLQVLAPGQQPAPSLVVGSGFGAGRYGAGGFGLDASASSYGDGPFGPGPTTSE